MEVWVELKPVYGLEMAAKALKYLSFADKIDIPDQPVGVAFSSPIAASYLSCRVGGERIVAHIRTVDFSAHSLKAIVKTLSSLGVSNIVLLRGDPLGREVGLKPEEAYEIAARYRERFGVKLGFILSLRRSVQEMFERLRLNPDFVLVLNSSKHYLWKLEKIRQAYAGEVIAYLVIATEKSVRLLQGRITSAMYTENEVLDLAEKMVSGRLVDGVLVSAPGDDAVLERVARRVKRYG
ncbi:methylenetetrahydrofolate reductase [Aeropyrum pernix]|uniref:methylenetetrahydrofolate reductase n=1 Tax=Aeropyrum pernix TaxID=56636 RepID=UPI00103746AC|nr:methylenetetrahydrofolate reductase [Aeropyrum pernix]